MPPPGIQLPLPLPPPQPGTTRDPGLTDRLCTLIERRGRALEVGHIASQLLRLRSCPERLQRRLVAELVESDPRLAWHGRDLIGLAPQGWAGRRLEDAAFCVVDLETTGGMPGTAKITEIGAARIEGLRIIDRFSMLVDPGRPIPPVIRELTGITQEMVAGQPPIAEALEEFIAFARDDVLVAHNAGFDLRFLNYERRRLVGSYFTQPWIDTLVLARRMLRGRVERNDLGTLAIWADTRVRPCHRALPDAEATAELLIALIPLLYERERYTLEQAVRFGSLPGSRHSHKLALAEDLPQAPGVYLMRDANGEVLYVGKATNLRRRVRAYFGPGGRHSGSIGRALERLERIDHEVHGSEFEAHLRESRLIRELRPPCNRRGVRPRGLYLKLTVAEAYPRLFATTEPADDDARYFGPVGSERQGRLAVEALHRLYPLRACYPICTTGRQHRLLYDAPSCENGPCGHDDPDRYAGAVVAVSRLLEGDVEALADLSGRVARAILAGEWTLGGEDDERLRGLLFTLGALGRLRRVASRWAVIVEPAATGDLVVAFFVAGGRIVDRAEIAPRRWRARVEAGLARIRAQERTVPPPPERWAADELMIVGHRLAEHGGRPGTVVLGPGWGNRTTLAAVGAGIRQVRAAEPALPAA